MTDLGWQFAEKQTAIKKLEDEQYALVVDMLRKGWPWADIGELTGHTRQAARQLWTRKGVSSIKSWQ